MNYPFAQIEKKWTKRWLKAGIYEPSFAKTPKGKPGLKQAAWREGGGKKKPFYNLMMFPYPSAEGLHVGNMYAFTGSDIYGRFKRMQGYDVFEPIGLDGFGIHSENYALKIGTHPAKQAKISEKNFYRQLQSIGNGFAWNERLETYDPEYYKWTQWIFIQLWKRGLAYRKKQSVNWCPSCKTVLADEQVINGACERCGTKVVKKELEQWFFRITKYAEKLLKNLDKIDWSERVKIAQRNWIGRSEGALIEFKIQNSKLKIKVFTTRPDTIYGATYLVLAPEHPLVPSLLRAPNHKIQITNRKAVEQYIEKAKKRTAEERMAKAKTGIELKGIRAINPATKKEIPIWVADYVLAAYGTGAIMGVPAYDERDFQFAQQFRLPIVKAPLVKAEEIIRKVGGQRKVQYHLRDWLISRQRYWGPPIPMIYCEQCARAGRGERKEMPGWYAAAEKDLPVRLPRVKNFRPTGTGQSPLASVKSFYEVKCPKCGGKARRETDVSDTFLDSAWYWLAYLAKVNAKFEIQNSAFRNLVKRWLPVDMYIGGAEHAVLHLLYSRFITMVFKDMGLVHFDEPFSSFRAHGLLISEGAKMSKSKGNVVVPDAYIRKFGADAIRLYLMFLGPFEEGGDWRDAGIMGPVRFLGRVWHLAQKGNFTRRQAISPWLHPFIKKITDDISHLRYNTAIAELMKILNSFEQEKAVSRSDFETFLLLLAPFAPFITEEIWEKLGNKFSIHIHPWPQYEVKYLSEDSFSLIIQVNGKTRGQLSLRRGIGQQEAERAALANPRIQRLLAKQKIKKVIFVPDRLINFVV
jgi:leucyl-tRNA synthetase